MNRHNMILLAVLMAMAMSSCSERRSVSTMGRDRSLESRRDLLSSIQKGMTEQQVLDILGKPDEIRIKGDLGIVAEKYRWSYGVDRKREFPRIGSVIFGTNKTVFMTFCPAKGLDGMLGKRSMPFSQFPQKTPAGTYCEIERVFRNKEFYDSHYIRVSVVNQGKDVFLIRHSNTVIHFSLILEL